MGGSSRAAPMARAIGVVAACCSLGACYALQPRLGTDLPPLGSRIAVDITDAGRVALGGQMGPEISQVEGRLVGNGGSGSAAELELAVTTVRLLRGGEQVWKGERVTIRREFVSRVYDRQFSKGRTAVAGAIGAGVVAYFVTRAIEGFARGGGVPAPPDSSPSLRRPVHP